MLNEIYILLQKLKIHILEIKYTVKTNLKKLLIKCHETYDQSDLIKIIIIMQNLILSNLQLTLSYQYYCNNLYFTYVFESRQCF